MSKLYNELAADWYQLLTTLIDYTEEADFFHHVFSHRVKPAPVTMLELGAGAGHNAYHLKEWYKLTLSDISEIMLSLSRKLNRECEHIVGDMKSLRLGKTFDAVFIHDAIMYMTSEYELEQALATAFIHCKPGGAVLISPDYVKETFTSGTDDGGSDGEGRALRYLEWKYDPDPADCIFTVDYACILHHPDGSVSIEHDQHIEGLFSKATWMKLLKKAGFHAVAIPDKWGRINFLGHKGNESEK